MKPRPDHNTPAKFAFVRLLPLLGLCLLAAAAACTHPVRCLVFQPHKIEQVPPFPDDRPHLQRFWLQTDQGPVEGWVLPGLGVAARHPGPAVMLAHGNRELIDDSLERALRYRRMGFTVMMGEYRGYGRSAGSPSRAGIADDYRRFYDRLAARPGVDPDRILFHGRSLGAAVLCDLSVQRRSAAVILESTFTSIKDMAHGAPDFLLVDNYDTVEALSGYRRPVLIIHGRQDAVVPVAHALALKQQIAQARLILYDFGHSDGPPDVAAYWRAIRVFLQDAGIVGPGKCPA